MKTKNLVRMVVVAVALVCISAGYVRADKTILLNKLSKDVNIELNDVTITEALRSIGQKAGVYFSLSDEAVWKLPQGEATRLSVALDGPLADSMTEMLNALFMRYAVGDEKITIYPRPELQHILGRPTAKQLELLKRIYTLQLSVTNQALVPGDLAGLINKAFGPEGLVVLPVKFYSDLRSLLRLLGTERSAPVTLAQMLDSCGEWYLSGMDFPNQIPEIRVVSVEDFRSAKLDQIVDISFKDETAETIIQRLANWTGMELEVFKNDPLWLEEKITVDMQNIKLRQALLNIASTMDGSIEFDISDNEVEIYERPERTKKTAATRATTATRSRSAVSEGYVGKISIPMEGGKYFIEFMLRESDLTEQLKKLREEKMKEILGEAEQSGVCNGAKQ